MPLQLTLKDNPDALRFKVKDTPRKKVQLALRKTLDGNLIVQDHQSISVIIMPSKGKILALPKGEFNDDCYTDQDQMFQYLINAGVVLPDSVVGGNIYGSLEGKFPTEKLGDEDPLDVVILNISDFLHKDKEEYSVRKNFIDALERELLDPDAESSTELGEVPQEKFKGSIPLYGFPSRGIYRYNY